MNNAGQPLRTWVYHLLNKDGVLLYVGITTWPRGALNRHLNTRYWWNEVKRARWFYMGRIEDSKRRAVEKRHIQEAAPLHNIQHNTLTRRKAEQSRIRRKEELLTEIPDRS